MFPPGWLIYYETDEILPYGGKPQPRKEWGRDMGLREPIKISNVAIYQELPRRIGIERMREGVRRLGYGNMEIGGVIDRFWLNGPLAISAVEQAIFLRFLRRPIPMSCTARASWLVGPTPPEISWWVGWIERENKAYPFALNFDIQSNADSNKRIPLGRECAESTG